MKEEVEELQKVQLRVSGLRELDTLTVEGHLKRMHLNTSSRVVYTLRLRDSGTSEQGTLWG